MMGQIKILSIVYAPALVCDPKSIYKKDSKYWYLGALAIRELKLVACIECEQ